ncbi:hypothetical protein C8J56DRAFT_1062139 [Mycena floridula]|nr:hypothetical protein C8J56DRAFT_1062139 [Mycena floridula]
MQNDDVESQLFHQAFRETCTIGLPSHKISVQVSPESLDSLVAALALEGVSLGPAGSPVACVTFEMDLDQSGNPARQFGSYYLGSEGAIYDLRFVGSHFQSEPENRRPVTDSWYVLAGSTVPGIYQTGPSLTAATTAHPEARIRCFHRKDDAINYYLKMALEHRLFAISPSSQGYCKLYTDQQYDDEPSSDESSGDSGSSG